VWASPLGSFSAKFSEIVGESPSAYAARAHDADGAMPSCLARFQTQRVREAREVQKPSSHGEVPETIVAQRGALKMSLRYTNIAVNDVDAALGFYRDALGLDVLVDVANGSFGWVMVGSASQPGLGVMFSAPSAGRSQGDGGALQQLLAKGVLPMFVFSPNDLDALFERVRDTGAEVLQEALGQPRGPRDCALRDLSGNMVRVNRSAG